VGVCNSTPAFLDEETIVKKAKKSMRLKYSPQEKAKVLARYDKGETVKALAAELKITATAIYSWIKSRKGKGQVLDISSTYPHVSSRITAGVLDVALEALGRKEVRGSDLYQWLRDHNFIVEIEV
jgi:transposase-like protein